MNEAVRLILFDMVGVMLRLENATSMLDWTAGRMSPDQLRQWWNDAPVIAAFETGRIDRDEFAATVTGELQLPVEPQEFLQTIIACRAIPFLETRETLAVLHDRFPLAILSNADPLLYDKALALDLLPFFRQTFFSHLTGLLKPDPAAFAQVVEQTGVPAEGILYFDDRQENIDAARDLGFRAHLTCGMTAVREILYDLNLLS
ncbi:MAG TPA: HAD-IA family hydrolase [bacterium]|nr:HAD-IA family hydrolase [bacterium]